MYVTMVEEAETNLLIHSFSLTFSLALLTSASTKVLPISAKFVQASCLVEQPTSSSSSPPWKETSSGNDETTNKAEFVREMFEGGWVIRWDTVCLIISEDLI